ncbi:MAG TPA: FmdB family transcriptional regulator [Urbifossiella sp.]|nr:FmdB family transcriptional regulator [Urbifossiella sp.]
MPIYVYEEVLPDGSGGEPFEVIQPMSAAALTTHPDTGKPVRRVLSAPNAPRAWTDSQAKTATSDKNLASKGFTKYVKSGDGTYEKTAGDGPKHIKPK